MTAITWLRALDTVTAQDDPLEILVREHAALVYRVAFSVLRNPADAEDVVQETFLRALRRRGQLRNLRQPRAWLARVAWRLALDRWRPRQRQQADPDSALQLLADDAPPAEDRLAQQQVASLLHTFIASLPADLREAVLLSTVEEMTSAESAAVLGISENSVRTRLFRARQLLKQKFAAALGVWYAP
jgi:RNA polymerase sigma-70 factor (ECF subfamily)